MSVVTAPHAPRDGSPTHALPPWSRLTKSCCSPLRTSALLSADRPARRDDVLAGSSSASRTRLRRLCCSPRYSDIGERRTRDPETAQEERDDQAP